MKKLFLAFCLIVSVVLFARDIPKKLPPRSDSKAFKAALARIYGDVRIVTHGADFNVKIVEGFEDLRVRISNTPGSAPGVWRVVEHGEDFSVRFVDCGEDFSTRFSEGFPGVN